MQPAVKPAMLLPGRPVPQLMMLFNYVMSVSRTIICVAH